MEFKVATNIIFSVHVGMWDVDKYKSFSMPPRDITQQIFSELVFSRCLTKASLKAFRDCALQDVLLGDYPRVKDRWMDVIASQGSSLLSADLSGSAVIDTGLGCLKDCTNLEALTFNYCDRISECGLKYISGMHVFFQLSKLGKVRHGEMLGDSGWIRAHQRFNET